MKKSALNFVNFDNFCLLLLLGLYASCAKHSEVTIKDGIANVFIENAEIIKAKEKPWSSLKGGFNRKISRGLFIQFRIPRLKRDDLKKLAEEFHVDSWIIETEKIIKGHRARVGTIYIPLFTNRGYRGKIKIRPNEVERANLQVNYRAASVAPSHTRFKCPPYGHRKKIENIEIRDISFNQPGKITLSVFYKKDYYNHRVEKFTLGPNPFNGGDVLIGEYRFKIAMYSSSKKKILSNYHYFPQQVEVTREKDVHIDNCMMDQNNADDLIIKKKRFKWKR
ncbi:MAG: hypothetical protein HOE90_05130 [Bacteriovoracaceae bacterium]|jgi:hypothetical protein|nr:hypothetical protein [Bacteriovoracaceae bacterium]